MNYQKPCENILITASVLLWQQRKVLSSIYFMHDKMVDFPKSRYVYTLHFMHACVVHIVNPNIASWLLIVHKITFIDTKDYNFDSGLWLLLATSSLKNY